MSKMGQELDRKLDEAKYDLYEALKELLEWAELSYSDDTGIWADKYDPAIVKTKKVLAKVES